MCALRKALRDALEKLKGVPVTNGITTMIPEDHLGLD